MRELCLLTHARWIKSATKPLLSTPSPQLHLRSFCIWPKLDFLAAFTAKKAAGGKKSKCPFSDMKSLEKENMALKKTGSRVLTITGGGGGGREGGGSLMTCEKRNKNIIHNNNEIYLLQKADWSICWKICRLVNSDVCLFVFGAYGRADVSCVLWFTLYATSHCCDLQMRMSFKLIQCTK